LVTTPETGPDRRRIATLAADLSVVRAGKVETVLVSSGAIATGMARLALPRRPRSMPEKQAAAAIGQSALMRPYEVAFKRHGLDTANPAVSGDARKLDTVEAVTDDITRLVWEGAGAAAVGGMATKLQAAQKAAAAGVPMIIANGRTERVLARLLDGEPLGTYFAPKADRLGARKRWIAFAVPPQGRLTVDA